MSYYIPFILGGCIAIYVGARVLRWLVEKYSGATGKEFAPHNVRYASIGAATIMVFLVSGVGEGTLSAPDYSYSWAYLVSGLVVFGMSLGHSYEMWREAQQPTHEEEE